MTQSNIHEYNISVRCWGKGAALFIWRTRRRNEEKGHLFLHLLRVYSFTEISIRFLRVCVSLCLSESPVLVLSVCGLAVYPCFKASVSLMRLCCKRSSLGLLTCSAFQTHTLPAARRPLAHPLLPSHTHTHTVPRRFAVPKH